MYYPSTSGVEKNIIVNVQIKLEMSSMLQI